MVFGAKKTQLELFGGVSGDRVCNVSFPRNAHVYVEGYLWLINAAEIVAIAIDIDSNKVKG
jgi:hypothetical protein